VRVVVDTNVWVSGALFPRSVPGRVVEAVRTERAQAVATWELVEEIADTLARPRLVARGVRPVTVVEVLAYLEPLLPSIEAAVEVRDPDDAPVVQAALSCRAEAIVTGDHDILDDASLRRWLGARGVEVLTAAEFLDRLGAQPEG
jgi:putative PIN family toxin of toxin-antitoxin system